MKNRQDILDCLVDRGVTPESMVRYKRHMDALFAQMPDLPEPVLVSDIRAHRQESEERLQALSLMLPIALLEGSRYQIHASGIDIPVALEALIQVIEVAHGVIKAVQEALKGPPEGAEGEEPSAEDMEELSAHAQAIFESLGIDSRSARMYAIPLRRGRGRSGRAPRSDGAATPPPPEAGPPGGPYATSEDAFKGGAAHAARDADDGTVRSTN